MGVGYFQRNGGSAVVVSLVVFAGVFLFLRTLLPGIQLIEIDLEIDHEDKLKVYYSNTPRFHERKSTSPIKIFPERTQLKIQINGYSNRLRIDTGDKSGTAKIYRIKIASYFTPVVELDPKAIAARFTVEKPGVRLQLEADHVSVASTVEDPYILSKNRLLERKDLLAFGIPLIFAALVWIVARPLGSGAGVAEPGDLKKAGACPSKKIDHFYALDGLRGVAAIWVVADHTWGWFRGTGASGVWVFFALSGFLLARPFVHEPERVFSLDYLSGYFRRRFKRILPMFYTYLFVVFFLTRRIETGFLHAVFLQGDGHLWAIPQEIAFYIGLPLVLATVQILLIKRFAWTVTLWIFLAMAIWNRYMDTRLIWLLGMDHIRLPLFFGVFLSGVGFSFIYERYMAPLTKDVSYKRFGVLCSLVGFAILLFFLLFSTGALFGSQVVYSQKYVSFYGLLAGVLVFCAAVAKGRLLERFLTFKPFRALGIVGFSLYLIHPLVKNILEEFSVLFLNLELSGGPRFVLTLAFSFVISAFTYTRIEQPGATGLFLQLRKASANHPGARMRNSL